jgi:hypothetical protein
MPKTVLMKIVENAKYVLVECTMSTVALKLAMNVASLVTSLANVPTARVRDVKDAVNVATQVTIVE